MTPNMIKARLVELAQKEKRDYYGLSLEFAIERLIVKIQSNSKLQKHLVFKGGYVMLKCYGSNRTTVDLDTSIHGLAIEEAIELIQKVLVLDTSDGLWMGGVVIEEMDHQTDYHGVRMIIRFHFGLTPKSIEKLPKIILDIGVADRITPGPRQDQFSSLILEDPISWKVYPVETIVAEKLHALVCHGEFNSRAKDIYDLSILLPLCNDFKLLESALENTFNYRQTKKPSSFSLFWKKLDKTILKRSYASIETSSDEKLSFNELVENLASLLAKIP